MLLFIIIRLRLCSAEAEVTLSVMREQHGISTLKCPTEKEKVGKISDDVQVACSHPLLLTAIKLSVLKARQAFLHSEENSKDIW